MLASFEIVILVAARFERLRFSRGSIAPIYTNAKYVSPDLCWGLLKARNNAKTRACHYVSVKRSGIPKLHSLRDLSWRPPSNSRSVVLYTTNVANCLAIERTLRARERGFTKVRNLQCETRFSREKKRTRERRGSALYRVLFNATCIKGHRIIEIERRRSGGTRGWYRYFWQPWPEDADIEDSDWTRIHCRVGRNQRYD